MLLGVMALVLLVAGAWWVLGQGEEAGTGGVPDIHKVARGEFRVVIPASGQLEALRQIKVQNKMESRAVLTEIVNEGTYVRAGDVLFRLADEETRNRIKDAEDAVKTAEAGLASARANLSVKESAAESDRDKADLDVRLAELAYEAWLNGEEGAKRTNLEVAKRTAEINYERLVKKYDESQRLATDGHISLDELERDRIAMIEAEAKLTSSRLDLEVYANYQFQQDKAKKESDLEQAKAELGRVCQRNEAEINNAKAALSSAEFKLQSARERLADLQEQLGYCTVLAPSDGLVVYASSLDGGNRWGGGSDRQLQVGTELRPNEEVIYLPDTSQMVASVKVNEALTGRIRPGQSVMVVSDALPNVPLRGEVLSIGVLAEQGGWRDPNRRDYTVRVLLTDVDPSLGLKPSMRCAAQIVVETVEDAVHVPIQAVFRDGPKAFVFAEETGLFEKRSVTIGRASELEVEIVAGIDEGDRVLLREPRPEELRKLDAPAGAAPGGAPPAGREAGGRRGVAAAGVATAPGS